MLPTQGQSAVPKTSVGQDRPPRPPEDTLGYSSLPAVLRTTRCSGPGGSEVAPATTAKQNASTQTGTTMAGAGAAVFSSRARGHAAPPTPGSGGRAPLRSLREESTEFTREDRGGVRPRSCARTPGRPARRLPGLRGRLAPAAFSQPRSLPPPLPGCHRTLPGQRQ